MSAPPRQLPKGMEALGDTLGKLVEKMDPGDFAAVAGIAGDVKAMRQGFDALRQDVTTLGENIALLDRKLNEIRRAMGLTK